MLWSIAEARNVATGQLNPASNNDGRFATNCDTVVPVASTGNPFHRWSSTSSSIRNETAFSCTRAPYRTVNDAPGVNGSHCVRVNPPATALGPLARMRP
jgi:hypothetical protein